MGANPAHRSPSSVPSRARSFRRGSPHQAHTPGGTVAPGSVDLKAEVVQAIAEAALRAGLTVAAWRQRAYEEQLQREKP